MNLPSAFLLQISMANPQEYGAIVPLIHEVSMLLGPEIIKSVNPAKIKGISDYLQRVLSRAKGLGNL